MFKKTSLSGPHFVPNFFQGHGLHVFVEGKKVSSSSWNNISAQTLQVGELSSNCDCDYCLQNSIATQFMLYKC